MLKNVTNNVKIAAIAAAVSPNYVNTDNFKAELGEETIEKFKKMTGVERHHAVKFEQTASDLCFAAARYILQEKHIPIDEIGMLIFVTQSPDYNAPATACVLQMRLGLSKDCIAFDVNLGCSGYVNGLNIASALLNNSNIKYALMLAGDTNARERSRKVKVNIDNSFKLLFGDAGTATLLEHNDKLDDIKLVSSMRTDGRGFKAIIRPYNGWRNPDQREKKIMDDIAVFNFTISEVPKMIKEFMSAENTTPDDYDDLVLHQANLFILKQIAKRTGFPIVKVPISLDEYGNTSSASIPLTLVRKYGASCELKTIHSLMCGFGIGLSWGIVSAKINTGDIFPIIFNDDVYCDGYNIVDK